jgi:hypothetical protein
LKKKNPELLNSFVLKSKFIQADQDILKALKINLNSSISTKETKESYFAQENNYNIWNKIKLPPNLLDPKRNSSVPHSRRIL